MADNGSELEQVCELAQQRLTITQIARYLGVRPSRISLYRKKGVDFPASPFRRRKPEFTREQIENVACQGLSLRAAARALGTSLDTIVDYRDRYGIVFPGQGSKRRWTVRRCPCKKEAKCRAHIKATGCALCEKKILLYMGSDRSPLIRSPDAVGIPESRLWSQNGGEAAIVEHYNSF